MGSMERLDAVRRDLRFALRRLLRAPGFTVASVLTLALGIGGVTAIGTVVNAVLLQPLPYAEPGRLVGVWQAVTKAGIPQAVLSDAEFFAFRRLGRAAQDLGAYFSTEANLSDASAPERVPAAAVSAGIFAALRVAPLLGRVITEADDQPGGPPVVVLSEGLWRRKLGAAPDVLGRALEIDGQAHQVIGVMPSRLAFPQGDIQLWLPLALDPAKAAVTSANLTLIARLRPGFSPDAAQRDFQQALDRIPELYPNACCGFSTWQWLELARPRVLVHPLRDDVVGDIGRVLWVLLGTAGFVLLVACANVASLFLVRAEARQREMAVRVALGAGRAGVVSQFAGEGLVLAGVGAAVGLGLTAVAIRLLARSGAVRIPRLGEVAVNGTTLALAAILTVLVGLGCSLLPIRRFQAGSVAPLLRSGGRTATGGRDRQRARQILVVAQVALAFALLAGSGLLARTFRELRAVRPGLTDVDLAHIVLRHTAMSAACARVSPTLVVFLGSRDILGMRQMCDGDSPTGA